MNISQTDLAPLIQLFAFDLSAIATQKFSAVGSTESAALFCWDVILTVMSATALDKPLRNIAVLVSAETQPLQALINAQALRSLDGNIALVVTNAEDEDVAAIGSVVGDSAETLHFPYQPYIEAQRSRFEYDVDLADKVAAHDISVVVLAGWNHILSYEFLGRFAGRIINLHYAAPQQFAGLNAIERGYDAFRRLEIDHSGCKVHLVTPEMNAGPIVASAIVPIHPTDTFDQFDIRIRAIGDRLLVLATQIALEAIV